MYCKKCGNQLKEDDKFCTNCGNSIEISSSVEQVQNVNGVSEKKKKKRGIIIFCIAFLMMIIFSYAVIALFGIGIKSIDHKPLTEEEALSYLNEKYGSISEFKYVTGKCKYDFNQGWDCYYIFSSSALDGANVTVYPIDDDCNKDDYVYMKYREQFQKVESEYCSRFNNLFGMKLDDCYAQISDRYIDDVNMSFDDFYRPSKYYLTYVIEEINHLNDISNQEFIDRKRKEVTDYMENNGISNISAVKIKVKSYGSSDIYLYDENPYELYKGYINTYYRILIKNILNVDHTVWVDCKADIINKDNINNGLSFDYFITNYATNVEIEISNTDSDHFKDVDSIKKQLNDYIVTNGINNIKEINLKNKYNYSSTIINLYTK